MDRPYRFLLVLFVLDAGGEIIDLDIFCLIVVLILRAEDLAGELFFQRLLAALGLESLRAVAGGFGIGTKVFPCRPVAVACTGIAKIRSRAAHGRAGRSRATGRR